VKNSAMEGATGTERSSGHENAPARLSMWTAVSAYILVLAVQGRIPILRSAYSRAVGAIPDLRFFVLFGIPGAGLVAVVSGVAGLLNARAAGGGRGQALAGLLGGIGIILLAALEFWIFWTWTHSNWQF